MGQIAVCRWVYFTSWFFQISEGNASTDLLFVYLFISQSFGETVQLLHPFHEQFSDQSGTRILRLCKFQQKKTKIAQVHKDASRAAGLHCLHVLPQQKHQLFGAFVITLSFFLVVYICVCDNLSGNKMTTVRIFFFHFLFWFTSLLSIHLSQFVFGFNLLKYKLLILLLSVEQWQTPSKPMGVKEVFMSLDSTVGIGRNFACQSECFNEAYVI